MDVYFPWNAHLLHLDPPTKVMAQRVETTQNWTAFQYFILWAEVDQPNEVQIKRAWSC